MHDICSGNDFFTDYLIYARYDLLEMNLQQAMDFCFYVSYLTCIAFFEKKRFLPQSMHFLTVFFLQYHWYYSNLSFHHNQIQQCRWEPILQRE